MMIKENLALSLNSKMLKLAIRIQDLRTDNLDPEVQKVIDDAQELIGDLCISIEKRIKKVAYDYSFLARDHVFFDGDHEDHSGAV